MTTIAYKDGVIAYDSRCTKGSAIMDDDYDKHKEVDGVHFFFAGQCDSVNVLIKSFTDPDHKGRVGDSAAAIVWDGESLFTVDVENNIRASIYPERLGNPLAIGSGEQHALTAMDMGATAEEAVKAAMRRDTGTGGRIRTFTIK